MCSSGNTMGPLLPQVPAWIWAGWVLAARRPAASRRIVNDAPAVVTVAVPVTLLPLSGVSFVVRTMGEDVTGVGDAAATGEVCATVLAPKTECSLQAASATGTIMVNTNRLCIRYVLATRSLRQAPDEDQPTFGRIAFTVERRPRGWRAATYGGQMSDSAKCIAPRMRAQTLCQGPNWLRTSGVVPRWPRGTRQTRQCPAGPGTPA